MRLQSDANPPNHPPCHASRSRPLSIATATATVLAALSLTLPPCVRSHLALLLTLLVVPLPAPRFLLAALPLRLLQFSRYWGCYGRPSLLHLPLVHLSLMHRLLLLL